MAPRGRVTDGVLFIFFNANTNYQIDSTKFSPFVTSTQSFPVSRPISNLQIAEFRQTFHAAFYDFGNGDIGGIYFVPMIMFVCIVLTIVSYLVGYTNFSVLSTLSSEETIIPQTTYQNRFPYPISGVTNDQTLLFYSATYSGSTYLGSKFYSIIVLY
jgi:hypothetical protein